MFAAILLVACDLGFLCGTGKTCQRSFEEPILKRRPADCRELVQWRQPVRDREVVLELDASQRSGELHEEVGYMHPPPPPSPVGKEGSRQVACVTHAPTAR